MTKLLILLLNKYSKNLADVQLRKKRYKPSTKTHHGRFKTRVYLNQLLTGKPHQHSRHGKPAATVSNSSTLMLIRPSKRVIIASVALSGPSDCCQRYAKWFSQRRRCRIVQLWWHAFKKIF